MDLLGMTGLAPRRRFRREDCHHRSLCRRGARSSAARGPELGDAAISASCPGVRWRARPASGSLKAWIFVVRPPRERPIACLCSPLFRRGRAMGLDRGRIIRQRDAVFAWLGQRLEDCLPSSALGPPVEAIVDRRVRTIFGRTIAPSRTGLEHVHDAADNAPIVIAFGPRQFRRQMRSIRAHCLSFSQNNPSRILSPPNQKHVGKKITVAI